MEDLDSELQDTKIKEKTKLSFGGIFQAKGKNTTYKINY